MQFLYKLRSATGIFQIWMHYISNYNCKGGVNEFLTQEKSADGDPLLCQLIYVLS